MRAYLATSALDERQRKNLITEHVEMARRIALRMARNTSLSSHKDDVVSVAMMGLVEAANRYDTTRGEPFGAFAQKRIRGAVLDELRRRDVLPRRVRHKVKEAGEVQRRIEQEEGRPAEDEEVARALGMSLVDYHCDLEAAANISFVELDADDRLAEFLTYDDAAPSPAELAERRQRAGFLKGALRRIPERDARILSLYYVEEFTYSEIAGLLGVSAPRVCQLHSRALTRLRAELADLVQEEAA